MNKWAQVRETHDPQYTYIGGGCYRVEEVCESDYQPGAEWQSCYDSTTVGWYHESGVFISRAQLIYVRDNMYPLNGRPAIPLPPDFRKISTVSIISMGHYLYREFNIDINNTTFMGLKNNLSCINGYRYKVTGMNGSKKIKVANLRSAWTDSANRNHMYNRLNSVATAGPVTIYDNGKKMVISEESCQYVNNDYTLMKWFDTDELVVISLQSETKRPQVGAPDPLELAIEFFFDDILGAFFG